jgi:transcriptional regulator with XRE-family HTH domain
MSIYRSLQEVLVQARVLANLSAREAGRQTGTSHATLLAYESGRKCPGIDTFERVLNGLGFDLEFTLHRRIRERHGMPRDEELMQVLELAQQFPAKPKRTLDFPKLGKSHD